MSQKVIVKIVEVPATKVLSWRVESMHPEAEVYPLVDAFAKPRGLYDDPLYYQVYGFDNPLRKHKDDTHGREVWVTVPDDLTDTGDATVKQFGGGLYAMVTIKGLHNMDAAWNYLIDWSRKSPEYTNAQHQHLERGVDPNYNGSDEEMLLELYLPIARKAAPTA